MQDPRTSPILQARRYAGPLGRRSALQLGGNSLALALLWFGMWISAEQHYWLTLVLALPAAGFLLRLFMVMHDCGHGSYFASARANDAVGWVIGVLLLTPYVYWKHSHAVHHATSGDLSRRGIGDIDTLTVAEYRGRSGFGRLSYRLYRHPLVLLGLGPWFQMFLRQRIPVHLPEPRRACVRSILSTNLALASLLLAAHLAVGLDRFLWVWVPPLLPTAGAGIWLFYVQHQFEDAYWAPPEDWSFEAAALRGSSFYDLPAPLRFFTSSIGYHHVHHLCSRIPNYRLREFVDDHPELACTNRLTLRDSLACARLALFDEASSRLIAFREIPARAG